MIKLMIGYGVVRGIGNAGSVAGSGELSSHGGIIDRKHS